MINAHVCSKLQAAPPLYRTKWNAVSIGAARFDEYVWSTYLDRESSRNASKDDERSPIIIPDEAQLTVIAQLVKHNSLPSIGIQAFAVLPRTSEWD